KDSHPKPANGSLNVWASCCRCPPKQNRLCHHRDNHSSTFSYRCSWVRLCFSKMQTCRIPKVAIFRARLGKLSPSCACECASEAVVKEIPFSIASSMIQSPG